jgi:transposase
MWTPTTRRQHSRDHLRYGSDLTDQEWEIIAPFMPPPARTGRPRLWTMREIMNAIFYVLRAGCAWRLLPKDFPPMTTVYGWFLRFRRQGLFATLNHYLVMLDRERVGRECQRRSDFASAGRSDIASIGGCCLGSSRASGFSVSDSRRFGGLSFGDGVADVPLLALFEPVAVAVHLEDVDVMGQPVEERAGQALGGEHAGPLIERQV